MKIRKMGFVCGNLLVSILLMGCVTGCSYSNDKQEVVATEAEVAVDTQQHASSDGNQSNDKQELTATEEKEEKSSVENMEPELKELKVVAKPEKISYLVGEILETEGMVLEAVFSDGSTSAIEDGYICFPTELIHAGEHEIAVFYDGVTTEFTVKVEEPVKVTDVTIASLPYTTTYMVGQKLDQNGLTLEIKYSDGSREVIRRDFQCMPTELTEVGRQDIMVSYEGKDIIFEVDVVDSFVFDNMIVQCVSVGNDKYPGVNVKGELVNWCLQIQFDLSDEMRNMFKPVITDCSWGHVVNGNEWEYVVNFEDANNGVTYAEFATISGEYTASGKDAYISMIHLPDDSSIQGEQSVTIQVGDVKKVFSFNLTYKGDYENGTGWSVDKIYY